MPKRGKSNKKKFCLLRWLEDETVSVLPATAAKTGQKVYPGCYCKFKWLTKFYEVEILKVLGTMTLLLDWLPYVYIHR